MPPVFSDCVTSLRRAVDHIEQVGQRRIEVILAPRQIELRPFAAIADGIRSAADGLTVGELLRVLRCPVR